MSVSERLKQRIVGAIVLVSLAVIFLPMILDGSGQKQDTFVENPIPLMPGFKFEPLDIPIKAVRPTTKPARVVENEQQIQKPVSKTENSPTPLNPADEDAKRLVDAWVVQIGSFTKSDNAFSLRDRLRKQDLRVFVEQLDNSKQSFYRVRVGPYKLRLEAEAAQVKIKNSYKIDGKIMKHP